MHHVCARSPSTHMRALWQAQQCGRTSTMMAEASWGFSSSCFSMSLMPGTTASVALNLRPTMQVLMSTVLSAGRSSAAGGPPLGPDLALKGELIWAGTATGCCAGSGEAR